MNDELLQVLERIASALETQNKLMEAQELRQRKLDLATYENLKIDAKKVIKVEPRFRKNV